MGLSSAETEDEAFGAEVSGGGERRLVEADREVAAVDVARIDRRGGIGEVEHHHTADALQPDECVAGAADLADDDALGFGAFVVGAAVEVAVFVVGAVEVGGKQRGDGALDQVARVEHERAGGGIEDREGATAVGVERVVVTVAVGVAQRRGDGEAAQVGVVLEERGGVGEGGRVQREALDRRASRRTRRSCCASPRWP